MNPDERQDVLVLRVTVPKEGGVYVAVDAAVLKAITDQMGSERAAQSLALVATMAGERIPRREAIFVLTGMIAALSGPAGSQYDNAVAIAGEHGLTVKDLAEKMRAATDFS